jgi:hypothetical protein
MGKLLKILAVILLSSVKFVAAPPFAYLNKAYTFTTLEIILYCVIGGMLGVIAFTYFSESLFSFWRFIKKKLTKKKYSQVPFSEPIVDIDNPPTIKYEYIEQNSPPKKIFSKRNRRIVLIWKKYGLVGIAFLTPVILSIPIGTLIANSLVPDKKKNMVYMFFSVLFWATIITVGFDFYHAENFEELIQNLKK